eukprot:gb/GECG01008210.1/.p1 GENE.gb/GECG01008210.1/~~gb/GECG01008210.1/.p1  ORF type:complete len:867 (+),score=177.83 gb/GECG01008210.1/:1-2601(+)
MSRTRQEQLNSLVAGETEYMQALNAVISSLYEPLRQREVLSKGQISAIFRTLPTMKSLHNTLSTEFHEVTKQSSLSGSVTALAESIMKHSGEIEDAYVAYCKGHEAAMHHASNALKSEEARSLIRALLDTEDERLHDTTLQGLLSLPFRRLVDYVESFSRLADATANLPEGIDAHGNVNSNMSIFDADSFLKDLIHECGGLPKTFLKRVQDEPLPYTPRFREVTSVVPATGKPVESGRAQKSPDERTGASSGEVERAKSDIRLTKEHFQHLQDFVQQSEKHVTAARDVVQHGAREDDQDTGPATHSEQELLPRDHELSDEHLNEALDQQMQRIGLESFSEESLKEVMDKLEQEENQLYDEIRQSEHRPLFEAFIEKKKQLLSEEQKLTNALEEHENALEEIRHRLANPPQSLLPSDPTKSSLYVTWKQALADREKLLRQARKRKHNLIRTLKARHESQVLAVEAKNRNKVNRLKEEIERERETAKTYEKDLEVLNNSIDEAKQSMAQFKEQFEQLRMSLVVDRMEKSNQAAQLSERRRQLQEEAEEAQQEMEQEKERIRKEEEEKWQRKIEEEKEEGERRIREEEQRIESKIQEVKNALAEKYEEGFRPLIEEAENQHQEELDRVHKLEKELKEKEQELEKAMQSAKEVAEYMSPQQLKDLGISEDVAEENNDSVPEWKLREFEGLKSAVATLWEELNVPDTEMVDFLSAADMAAPYDPKVLNLYKEMHSQLINALSEPLDQNTTQHNEDEGHYGEEQQNEHQEYAVGATTSSPSQASQTSPTQSFAYSSDRSPGGTSYDPGHAWKSPKSPGASALQRAMYEQLSARAQSQLPPSHGGIGNRLYKSPTSQRPRREKQTRSRDRLKW